ncbi:DUF1592 domain-containing protein [Allorhodopirellula solitaria]|uniref:Planctomycete cytochrome C n=1 Tax=Allorhodopirellula solitaria TaxID=2527987 RepID=A0A5C5YJH0_9BACT|nr:DUF1592 domain-containing protein [Allorhodopirellula solitaria]TWT75034.1 hypothetical protein CA85_03220 [Allorhodopirellula solitaria]
MRLFLSLLLFALPLCCSVIADELPSEQQAVMPAKHRAIFERYCFDCHDSASKEGQLDLESLSLEISRDIPTAEWWSKVLAALNAGEMPPTDAEQITDEEKAALLHDLSIEMVKARNILSDSGGEIALRRLNRREYQNTLAALLGFRPDVSNLPADDSTGGFDTAGASLFFSADQFEQYRATATTALITALSDRKKPSSQIHRVEPEDTHSKEYFDRQEQLLDTIKRADAFLAQETSPPQDFGFRDVAHAEKQAQRSRVHLKQMQDYTRRPQAKEGAFLLRDKGHSRPSIRTPKVSTAGGRYLLRIRAGAYDDSPQRQRYVEYAIGNPKDYQVLGQVKISGTVSKPNVVEIPIDLEPGRSGAFQILWRDYKEQASRYVTHRIEAQKNGIGQLPVVWVDWVEVEGPFFDEWPNTAKMDLIAPRRSHEDNATYARRLIQSFATRAFRDQTPADEYVDKLVQRYLQKRKSGKGHVASIIDAYALILSSPSFLYMLEHGEPTALAADPTGASSDDNGPQTSSLDSNLSRLTDRELAVRLAYFLWSAPPDAELYSAADEGTLSRDDVLRAQTDRLLNDPRSDEFISSFTHQWLDMVRLDMFDFDARFHPEFDQAVRRSARQEVYSTIRHVLDQRLPLGTLLKTDFVMVNDVLADFYGINGPTDLPVQGSHFRKVTLPPTSPRGGLLGTAAIHVMGADGTRSVPAIRGAWVLKHLLHDPPPPPPANIPQLSRLSGKPRSGRELQTLHQEAPQCAQCHRKIDPIGFGLENFTAAGLWRDAETVSINPASAKKFQLPKSKSFDIDSSGTLHHGESFGNYFELRDAIAAHEDAFARGFAEYLIAYALGRPYQISDHRLASDVTRQASQKGNRIDAFVHALVQSETFQTKWAERPRVGP